MENRLRACCIAFISITLVTPFSAPASTPPECVGDCHGDRQVTIDALLLMVNIALGNEAVSLCTPGDANDDNTITIDEILAAVNNALNGCKGEFVLTIANLQFTPTEVGHHQGNGTVQINGSFDFSDPHGDVTTLHVAAGVGSDQVFPIPGASGRTSGTITGAFSVSSEVLGQFPFRIWVTDGEGDRSNSLFGTISVAVDDTGTVWETQAVPPCCGSPSYHTSLAWSGTQFVAVGPTGSILRSPDGINWDGAASTDWGGLMAVASSGSLFAAVGGDVIFISADGVNWTPRPGVPIQPQGGQLRAIVWNGSKFVAVGWLNGPFTTSPPSALALTSEDGITWTPVILPDIAARWLDVVWTGTGFLAVGVVPALTIPGPPAIAAVASSPDGVNWTAFAPRVDGPGFNHVAWNGSRFVALASQGVFTSADGMDWQAIPSLANLTFYAVAWSGTRFLVVAGADEKSYYSRDGLTWTAGGTPNSAAYALAWVDDRWTAVGAGILSSP